MSVDFRVNTSDFEKKALGTYSVTLQRISCKMLAIILIFNGAVAPYPHTVYCYSVSYKTNNNSQIYYLTIFRIL